MPTVREIENFAFQSCDQLTDVEMPDVESMRNGAFSQCTRLRRIAIPLKDGIIDGDMYSIGVKDQNHLLVTPGELEK